MQRLYKREGRVLKEALYHVVSVLLYLTVNCLCVCARLLYKEVF